MRLPEHPVVDLAEPDWRFEQRGVYRLEWVGENDHERPLTRLARNRSIRFPAFNSAANSVRNSAHKLARPGRFTRRILAAPRAQCHNLTDRQGGRRTTGNRRRRPGSLADQDEHGPAMALGSDGQAAAHNQPPSGREESQRQKRRSLDRDVRSGCNRAPCCTPFGQKRTALLRKAGILRRHRSRYVTCRE